MIHDSGTINHADIQRLMGSFPEPPQFNGLDDVEKLTDDQALEVMRAVRRMLVGELLGQEHHEHMLDDCGDYLEAASTNWDRLWRGYFDNDGTGFTDLVKQFLSEPVIEWLACDGDVRFSMFPQAYIDRGFEHAV